MIDRDDFHEDALGTCEYVGSFTDDDTPDTAACAACWKPAFGSLLCPSCEAACDRVHA